MTRLATRRITMMTAAVLAPAVIVSSWRARAQTFEWSEHGERKLELDL